MEFQLKHSLQLEICGAIFVQDRKAKLNLNRKLYFKFKSSE